MANGENSAPEQNGQAPAPEKEVIRPRLNRHAGRAVKKVHREYREHNPFLFWSAMMALLAVYMILFAAVRWHQRAKFRNQAAAATAVAEVKAVIPVTAQTNLPPADFKEQISILISRTRETELAIEAAARLAESGDPAAAAEELRQQLEKDPGSFPLKLALARHLLAQGQRPGAIRLLTDALGTSPAHEGARLLLARALLDEQAHEEARQTAEWILKGNDYATDAHDIAASALMLGGRPAEAIPHLRRMAGLAPDSIAIENRLAQAHMRAGEYDKAVELFRTVMDTDPDNSVTYYNLAACYSLQNRPGEAVQTLNAALKLFDPSFVAAWLQGSDFDAIRTNDAFAALAAGLPKSSGN